MFSLASIVIFITVLALAGGVFGYKQFLSKKLDATKANLQIEVDKLGVSSSLSEITRLDSRIETARTLLNQHVALTSFFDYIGTVTLKAVRFASFSYTLGSGSGPTITMSGQGKGFEAVALQATEFGKPQTLRYIHNSSIADPTLDKSGNVNFNFRGELVPTMFTYRESLKGFVVPSASSSASTTSKTATSTAKTATSTASTTKPKP